MNKDELNRINESRKNSKKKLEDLAREQEDKRDAINDLINRVNKLQGDRVLSSIEYSPEEELRELLSLDEGLNELLDFEDYKKSPSLTAVDFAIGGIAGLISLLIDLIFVGTPDIVKVYRGGERFDGSLLTKIIRDFGENELGEFTDSLSKKYKVPYDRSIVVGDMNPNNHRLKSLGHDPFFGAFFSVFDILMNTTTYVDSSGYLRVLASSSDKNQLIRKHEYLIYYIGHIVSDMFTARGIPIPGFFLTQFFTNENPEKDISLIAEKMYKNGYDLRHLGSMAIPNIVKYLIIRAYIDILYRDLSVSGSVNISLTQREGLRIERNMRYEKIKLMADSISVGGNLIKFVSPPISCNPNALNFVEWLSFIRSMSSNIKIMTREDSLDRILYNRDIIEKNWETLQK